MDKAAGRARTLRQRGQRTFIIEHGASIASSATPKACLTFASFSWGHWAATIQAANLPLALSVSQFDRIWRGNLALKAQKEAERQTKRVDVVGKLGIKPFERHNARQFVRR
jgi:hypothetical protein